MRSIFAKRKVRRHQPRTFFGKREKEEEEELFLALVINLTH